MLVVTRDSCSLTSRPQVWVRKSEICFPQMAAGHAYRSVRCNSLAAWEYMFAKPMKSEATLGLTFISGIPEVLWDFELMTSLYIE